MDDLLWPFWFTLFSLFGFLCGLNGVLVDVGGVVWLEFLV